jgi:hypothetical protein
LTEVGTHTSYFASKKLGYANMNIVGISRSVPKFVKMNINVFEPLCPSWGLITVYKEGRITDVQYTRNYHGAILDQLDPEKIYQALGEDAVLLCWEGPGKFCHRHIVAEWLKSALKVNITEL